MAWLIIYAVGAVLMLMMCGAAIGDEITAGKFIGALIVGALWPLALPLVLGAALGGKR